MYCGAFPHLCYFLKGGCLYLWEIILSFWRRQWHPTPVLFPGKSHGQRSLVGYSPWGRKELDRTERLHTHTMYPFNSEKWVASVEFYRIHLSYCSNDSFNDCGFIVQFNGLNIIHWHSSFDFLHVFTFAFFLYIGWNNTMSNVSKTKLLSNYNLISYFSIHFFPSTIYSICEHTHKRTAFTCNQDFLMFKFIHW